MSSRHLLQLVQNGLNTATIPGLNGGDAFSPAVTAANCPVSTPFWRRLTLLGQRACASPIAPHLIPASAVLCCTGLHVHGQHFPDPRSGATPDPYAVAPPSTSISCMKHVCHDRSSHLFLAQSFSVVTTTLLTGGGPNQASPSAPLSHGAGISGTSGNNILCVSLAAATSRPSRAHVSIIASSAGFASRATASSTLKWGTPSRRTACASTR